MTNKEQNRAKLRQYLNARQVAHWLCREPFAMQWASDALNCLGGIAGSWRTDYIETTYYYPQRIGGVLVDLSTIDKVRAHYESPQL